MLPSVKYNPSRHTRHDMYLTLHDISFTTCASRHVRHDSFCTLHDISFTTYMSRHIPYTSRHILHDMCFTTRTSRHLLHSSRHIRTRHDIYQAVIPLLGQQERDHWPKSRRQVDDNMAKKVGSFHARVTRRASIDLSHLGLAGLHKPVVFTFMDPVFAWCLCADKLSDKHKLFFKYKALKHPASGALLYGSSVQHGMIMKKACERLPRFGLLACTR